MKAPEKVYIDDFGSGFSHGWHTEHSYEKDIEYVRKDAFIEKACEWINLHIGELSDIYTRSAIRNEFLEDFRKTMEE